VAAGRSAGQRCAAIDDVIVVGVVCDVVIICEVDLV